MANILRFLSFVFFFPIRRLFDIFLLISGFANDNIEFYQWTPHGRFVIDETNMDTLARINVNATTYFIVHGWHENSTLDEYELLAKNYYTMDKYANIILVDYGELAMASYVEAPAIVRRAGGIIGNKLIALIKQGLINVKRFNVFSHSLGTHVAGMAARIIRNELHESIARISASDPAGPLFRAPFGIGPLSDSLTKDDADVLDITHTSYLAGSVEAFGTVDTYVDLVGGRQPGCVGDADSDELLFCDHRLARAYFTESILSCGFHQTNALGIRIIYGEHMPLKATGIFRMQVNAKPPYAKDINTYPSC